MSYIFRNKTSSIGVLKIHTSPRVDCHPLYAELIDCMASKIDDISLRYPYCLNRSNYQELINSLHRFFIKNGDKDEYRNKYSHDAFQWYLASCQLSIASLFKNKFELCHIGSSTYVYHWSEDRQVLNLISPIHNIQCEIEAATIEESCLSPFSSISHIELAEQICEANMSIALRQYISSISREEFISHCSEFETRSIGFWQNPENKQFGSYRQKTPTPALIECEVRDRDSILFYLPRIYDLRNYGKDKISSKLTSYFKQGIRVPQNEPFMNYGQMLRLDFSAAKGWQEIGVFTIQAE